MELQQFFLEQLNAEAVRTRRCLEAVPEGRAEWKPHDKSMPFGRLAALVARMPSWIDLIISKDELDLTPAAGSNVDQRPLTTAADLVGALDEAVAQGRKALETSTDERLRTTKWRLLAGGHTVSEALRYVVIRDTFTHWAHHRAQLTGYLRLNDIAVPAVYGPSADDARFA